MTPTPRLTRNTWLRRITDRWELVRVTTVMSSGTLLIELLDGTKKTTTMSYLRGRFEMAGEDAA